MLEGVGAAEEMVRQWQERAAEKARKFEVMRSRIERISVSESSRDGAVRVTVGSNGMLQGLELAESAGNRSMARLSAQIMQTLRLAQSRIPELMQQAVAETVGTEDSAARHILGQARRNFPEAPAEEPAAAAEVSRNCRSTTRTTTNRRSGAIRRRRRLRLGSLLRAFTLGVTVSLITHGDPSGYLPGGVLAVLAQYLLHGQSWDDALDAALYQLSRWKGREATTPYLSTAAELGRRGEVGPESLDQHFGGSSSAPVVLGTAVAAAMSNPDSFPAAVLAAVNHAGNSATAGFVGGLSWA